MSILSFQKPDRVIELERKDEFTGVYEFRPLEPGYALTVGNAMRRVLLSSLEGYAILSVRFDGVSHEFSSIDGVIEDVTEIILNLKQLRFKAKQGDAGREEVTFQFSGKQKILGSDLESKLSQFEVLSKDIVICNLDPSVSLKFHLIIDKGRGYVSAGENKALIEESPLGMIFMDSVHTPIKNVRYSIENYRVEQRTDYEKLIFEVKTDGSILPKAAITEAAKILIQHLLLISDEDKIAEEAEAISNQKIYDEDSLRMRQLLKMRMEDLEVSARSLNCLSQNGVYTLGDLVVLKETDLMKFRNFGKISLVELKELLVHNGLSFGMDKDKII